MHSCLFTNITQKAIALLIGILFCLGAIAPPALASEYLPQPDPPFKGKMGLTYKESEPDPSMLATPQAPADAPNIFLVLIDDAGFGTASTFGGSIATPTLDKLAANGLRYNRFHTTALCSPTRAAILTGRNHHSAASGTIQELADGYPGYTGLIPRNTATVGQLLQQGGYSTAWLGKNHNVPDNQTSQVGPYDRRPNGLGFDYFYGFIGGETDQWYPTLYENQNPVNQPYSPEEGYNLNHDLADKAIAWMRYEKAIAPDRPFFMYFAPGAVHAPHQPPQEWVEKYKGKFDQGWDQEREIVFERQKKLGVIPANTKLTPRPEQMPGWEDEGYNSEEAHKLFAREMETYAGYLEYTDYEIGRVIDEIENLGQLDNTLIVYIMGDNGASAEGSFIGTCNELLNLNGLNLTIEDNLRCYDDWGSPETSPHFAVSWAWAMDTPFQWTKQIASHFGGTRNAMSISWPARIKDKGETRYQFSHAIDIAPTLFEVLGIPAPVEIDGIAQKPIEGISFAYTFDDESAPTRHTTQYFEMLGNQGIYHDGWMASALRAIPWELQPKPGSLLTMEWELYNIEEDFTQANDLAQENPQKLQEMKDLFYAEAAKYNVLPLDDRKAERFRVENRPSLTQGRNSFRFPNRIRVTEGAAPDVKGKNYVIAAEVTVPDSGAEGMLLTHGGRFGGYGLFVQDGKLVYHYNSANVERFTVTSDQKIPTGNVTLKAEYQTDTEQPGAGGTVTLYANNRKIGSGHVNQTLPNRISLDETFDVGFDTGTPVVDTYQLPFAFTGTLKQVSVDLK